MLHSQQHAHRPEAVQGFQLQQGQTSPLLIHGTDLHAGAGVRERAADRDELDMVGGDYYLRSAAVYC